MTGTTHYFIVRRGESEIFQLFREHFADVGFVDVIWDRRLGDRRRVHRDVAVERRRGERRHPAPKTWSAFGFVFAAAHHETPEG
ncbi:MAG: hypothetical protein HYS14_06580 [Candidatus Rokubacteria bacterium]|nr:hypothetical protein [Candidatus Rokubacteria bacterium]MBI3454448.1 hypothetical protein [Candidatus Rokubacteria bacterium]